jgi:hypothetical protein
MFNSGKVNLKTIIVMVILALVGVLSFLGVGAVKTYLSGAAAGYAPASVLSVPGDDGKSVTISWTTEKAAQSVVEYGTIPSSLLLRSLETEESTSHSIKISPLKPATTYYFRIKVAEEVFDNSGIPYSFKTKSAGAPEVSPTVKPTQAPTVAPTMAVPTTTSTTKSTTSTTTTSCNRTTDYNSDGVINSVDYIKCVNGGGKTATAVPTVAATTTCATNVDYDANGVVNSIDRIKCLQNQN